MLMKLKPKTHPPLDMQYGASPTAEGVEFSVYSKSADAMRLLLYDNMDDRDPSRIVEFDADAGRWGAMWRCFVPDLKPGQLYHFQCDGYHDPNEGQHFDPTARLIDPYAAALAGDFQACPDGIIRPPKCVVVEHDFDWGSDRPLGRSLSEAIVYEMHVKGFTASPTSGVKKPGTYLGVIEKIPYLQSLGVNTVELLPVHEFPINDYQGNKPIRQNYWGYDPLAFFAPHRGYSSSSRPGAQVDEFKEMVAALHSAGIEVILDVVFNHTSEGGLGGATLSFKGLENQTYYMLAEDGEFMNFSGCGNTFNCNHPVASKLILQCLQNWVVNYHIDGFRFDLASILCRDPNGNIMEHPPLIEMISYDPILADTKIIAEAWDAGGGYQVGSFGDERWAEWNGRYRDDVRKFWRGDWGMLGNLASRISGSCDIYGPSGRSPAASVNFITAHDGYTMNDLVSYEQKHNMINGEGNRDGENQNNSCNYGVEGPGDSNLERIRLQQIKNMLATMLLSQGVPMIVAGDECRRTQHGNNNPWCQDNEISWFNWDLVEYEAELVRFVSALNQFRRIQPSLKRDRFLEGRHTNTGWIPDVSWYNFDGEHDVDWHGPDLPLAVMLAGDTEDSFGSDMLILLNPTSESRQCNVAENALNAHWRLFFDTGQVGPKDIYPSLCGPILPSSGTMELKPYSMQCYVDTDVLRTAEARL